MQRPFNRVSAFALALSACLISAAYADSFDDALRAYERGQYKQAMQLWRGLAHGENAAAQYQLGLMHENGQGVTRCNAGAFDWYLRSARNGYSPAQSAVARMYEHGLGVMRNRGEAEKWERLAGTTRVARADGGAVAP